MASPVQTKPPTLLPRVTGIWFHSHQSLHVTLAPSSMPVGIMNMLTTACSKPCAKKMKIGIQAVAILPIVEFVPIASTTARQTIQLHRMPLTNAVTKPGDAECCVSGGLGFGDRDNARLAPPSARARAKPLPVLK